jgi:hypothetical protein
MHGVLFTVPRYAHLLLCDTALEWTLTEAHIDKPHALENLR